MTDHMQDLVDRLRAINVDEAEKQLAGLVALLRQYQADHPTATFDDALRLIDRRREDMALEAEPEP